MLEGAEERIRASPRKQKLTWVHSRLTNQKGIRDFWSTVPARSDVDAEVGRDLELVADIESGNVGQIPPDLPNKGQIRKLEGKEKKNGNKATWGNTSLGVTRVKLLRKWPRRRVLFLLQGWAQAAHTTRRE